jgi:NAD(P)H-flavin reductase
MYRRGVLLRCNPGPSRPNIQRPATNQWVKYQFYTPKELRAHIQKDYLNHKILGFAARCALFGASCVGFAVAAYRVAVFALEEQPIYNQWVPRHREITFIEKIQEGESDMWILRFALPNSYDYLGYKSVTSVEVLIDNHWLFPARRWYTPISHSEQRGIVEFAVKLHNPGELSSHFRNLEPGDKVLLGPWIKEWRYKPNQYREVGLVCANSGITPALQLLVNALDDPSDKTKFSLLYCNRAPDAIPFKKKLEAIQARYPDRFRVTFTVTSAKSAVPVVAERATQMLVEHGRPADQYSKGQLKGAALAYEQGENGKIVPVTMMQAKEEDYRGWVGLVNRDLVLEGIPPPADDVMVLCCGPQAFMANLCGRPVGWFRTTYFEGMYHGILKDMGYKKRQVYKFGTSWTNTMVGVA